jgi:hypothetical protein
MKHILLIALSTVALALAGCESTPVESGPDAGNNTADTTGTPSTPDGGNSTPDVPDANLDTVAGMQAFAEGLGCDPQGITLAAPGVSLQGVIVTSGRFDAFTPEDPTKDGLDGYFVADAAGGDFSGLFVVISRSEATDYKAGDVLNVTGDLEERYCFTQLMAATHEATGTADQPAPIEVTPESLGTEANESRIVTLKDVEVTEKAAWGGYVVTGGIEIAFGFADHFLSLNVGGTYDLTGAVKYSYSKFQLIPRSEDDIVSHGGGGEATTIDAIQSGDASANCTDSGPNTIASGVSFEGIVVQERFSAAATLDAYYLNTGTGEANSGILMLISSTKETNYALGSKVAVVGDYKEFYCLSEIVAQSVEVLSEGEAVPAAVAAGGASDLLAVAEPHEGMLVTISDVEITNTDDFEKYGYVAVNGTDLLIEGKILHSDDFPEVEVGTNYSSVTGFLTFSYDQYRIQPRTAADFVQ